MKKTLLFILLPLHLFSQQKIKDNAVLHQEERMVFHNWNKKNFDPKPGFLSLNPYYWLVWGLFYPSYHKKDLRPLSATGQQSQRLALVGVQNHTDNNYKLQSDTVRNTALSQIASQTGTLSDLDPLWLLYYKNQFKPLLDYSAAGILAPLPPQVSAQLTKEGLLDWYTGELESLKERLNGTRTTNQDRGSRILSYHRLLKEYKQLNGVWTMRTAAAQKTIDMGKQQQKAQQGNLTVPKWSPNSDVDIAKKVLLNRKY